ncbi:MAG TPA: hypothetical protein VEQ11_12920 [Chloroflexota bacterium]|nr:hypothetical protein [Chloroflexota bacterium]
MATTILVGSQVDAGRAIIGRLESAGIVVDSALWLQDEDTDEWRLVIASPCVDRKGPRYVYERLSEILATMEEPGVGVGNISVLAVADRFVRDLKRLVGTNDSLHNIRVDYPAIGGRTFRSTRIYRVSGGSLEKDARVRVKEDGRLGTVRGVVDAPGGTRYLVLYDLRPEDIQSLGTSPRPPVRLDFGAQDLEFLYVVRAGA